MALPIPSNFHIDALTLAQVSVSYEAKEHS